MMFQRWGFLMGEIWLLLLLAALLGLFAGWLIWGRRAPEDAGEADRLRAALEACNAKGRDQTARITALEGDLSAAKAAASESAAKAERAASAAAASASAAAVAAQAAPKAAASNGQAPSAAATPAQAKAAKASSAAPASKPDSGKAASAASDAAKETAPKAADKPKGLTKARGGKPDDLKLIKGVGPKLEALCNKLGFYHFDQIASWTEKEIAWVDDNLEGFKGRVTREDWVQQARDLMNGLPPRPGGEK
jgi:predicted flap endonuclease-1-like 5' DNA nuclease